MTEFETFVTSELSKISTTTAATKASLEGLNDRLFEGPASVIIKIQSDVQEIKDDRKSEAHWDRIHNIAHYALTPVVVAAHAVARHMGIDI